MAENIKTKKEVKKILKKIRVGADVESPVELEKIPEFNDPYEVEMRSLTEDLEKKLPADLVMVLKRLSYEITKVGLSEKEACLMTDYPYEKLVALRQKEPMVDRLIDMKNLEYERGILKNLSKKAQTDDKVGQWMLIRRNPKKYNVKAGTGGKGGDDGNSDDSLLAAAVEFVQTEGDAAPMVNKKSGKAVFISKSKEDIEKFDISKFLS